MRSRVVYQLACSRCNAHYVGQAVRHLPARPNEHIKDSSLVEMHLTQCGIDRDVNGSEVEKLDEHEEKEKLLILEA